MFCTGLLQLRERSSYEVRFLGRTGRVNAIGLPSGIASKSEWKTKVCGAMDFLHALSMESAHHPGLFPVRGHAERGRREVSLSSAFWLNRETRGNFFEEKMATRALGHAQQTLVD